MKPTHFSAAALVLFAACAVQQDPAPGTCNAKSVNCAVAGAGSGGGSAGLSSAGSTMAGANTGGMTPVAGAASGGASGAVAGGGSSGAVTAGAPAGGASAGAPAGGGGSGGAAAGAPAGGGGSGGAAAGAPAGGGGAGGAGSGTLVVIRANRTKAGTRNYLKVVAPENFVQWAATTLADAEVFEQISVGTDLIKLRATSINQYVALDQAIVAPKTEENDYLVANATLATAAVINNAVCPAMNTFLAACAPNCRGMQIMADDDANNFVVSDDQFTLSNGARVRGNDCGASAGAWEGWEFVAK